jgi:DNA-binding CsgD family transcriptional regulator
MRIQRDPRIALVARVFRVNAAVLLAAVAFLALTPLAVGWPLRVAELMELAAWTVGVQLINYVALRALFAPRPRRRRGRARGHELTNRELEVVRLIANGYTAKEIAELLLISPKTVDAHRAHILEKLGLRDRVALTRYAIRRGLIEP